MTEPGIIIGALTREDPKAVSMAGAILEAVQVNEVRRLLAIESVLAVMEIGSNQILRATYKEAKKSRGHNRNQYHIQLRTSLKKWVVSHGALSMRSSNLPIRSNVK